MGTTLMADEVGRILGKLEQGFENLTARFDRQDNETIRRDEKREADKQQAIAAREADKKEILKRFTDIEEKATDTYGMASAGKQWVAEKGEPLVTWHKDEGSKLGGRVSALEQININEALARQQADNLKAGQEGEKRGESNTWKWIWGGVVAVAGAIGSVIAAITGLSPETIDRIKALFHGG